MSVIICRTCGMEMSVPAGQEIISCLACGSLNSCPQSDEHTRDTLRRATQQRLRCDFRNAETSYQHVLLEYPEEHEALWGLAMCRFGVEYVNDPATGRHMPVVHGVQEELMQEDPDFLQACEYAPGDVRAQYEREARYIDDAQAEIRRLAQGGDPFDVFICHKTTRPGEEGGFTQDYNRAFRLYHLLDKAGYRVFFAPIEMESVAAGENYEAGIYHALTTSRLMLVVCSDPEYINSPWVQNEWKRFIRMMKPGTDKGLLPLLYGDLSPERLPREFRVRKLQGIRMGEMGAEERLMAAVERYAGRKAAAEASAPKPLKAEEPVKVVKPVPAAPAEVQAPEPVSLSTAAQPGEAAPAAPFRTLPVDGGVAVTKYTGPGGEVEIPAELDGRPVVEIGSHAFDGQRNVTRIIMPESVKCIGINAFRSCTALASVRIPRGVVSIGNGAFYECSSLRIAELPDSVTQIGHSAFCNCKSLASMVIPEGVTRIEAFTFSGCTGMRSARIPRSVKNIDIAAFAFCRSLRDLDLPRRLPEIHEKAFDRCELPLGVRMKLALAKKMK